MFCLETLEAINKERLRLANKDVPERLALFVVVENKELARCDIGKSCSCTPLTGCCKESVYT
jgi:hypothetical protein